MPIASAAPIIDLVDVHKLYGAGEHATAALDGVSLRVESGSFVALMGPSGSGKSTLLNLVAGLDVPSRGRVLLSGYDVGALRDHELSDLRLGTVGIVFQAFNLIPCLTVAGNVGWPLTHLGLSRRDVRLRVGEALERVGVGAHARRMPSELAGGEQQRVAIARAIATRPRLLLADEPTGNLDTHTGRTILDLLRMLNTTDAVTVLMVTHNTFAAAYGNRTVELRDGRIVRDVATTPLDDDAPGAPEPE